MRIEIIADILLYLECIAAIFQIFIKNLNK